jgi:hypothetical protein
LKRQPITEEIATAALSRLRYLDVGRQLHDYLE